MAYEVVWLPKAAKRYDEIIEWLRENWSDKEITNFIVRTKDVLELISTNPALYKRSEKENVHEAIVTKHNILLYRKKKNKVELMTFFDTRQNPSKKYKLTLPVFLMCLQKPVANVHQQT